MTKVCWVTWSFCGERTFHGHLECFYGCLYIFSMFECVYVCVCVSTIINFSSVQCRNLREALSDWSLNWDQFTSEYFKQCISRLIKRILILIRASMIDWLWLSIMSDSNLSWRLHRKIFQVVALHSLTMNRSTKNKIKWTDKSNSDAVSRFVLRFSLLSLRQRRWTATWVRFLH